MRTVIALDIGGTKTALALVNNYYEVSETVEIPVKGNPSFWEDIAAAVKALRTKAGDEFFGIGIGSAGPLHLQTGEISPVNISSWRRFPIVSHLQEITGTENVVLHGDAMALAHAEFLLGAGRGVQNMLGIVVSTGIGGGLILNGSLFTGEAGNVSYIGHHTINFDGVLCACGRRGCVETYASGPRMVAMAQERGWLMGSNFIELAESARQGDPIALQAIDEGAYALAVGIVNIIGSLDIRTVVIGGGVAQSGAIYWDRLREHCATQVLTTGFIDAVDLRPAQLARNSGLIGAALGILDKMPDQRSKGD